MQRAWRGDDGSDVAAQTRLSRGTSGPRHRHAIATHRRAARPWMSTCLVECRWVYRTADAVAGTRQCCGFRCILHAIGSRPWARMTETVAALRHARRRRDETGAVPSGSATRQMERERSVCSKIEKSLLSLLYSKLPSCVYCCGRLVESLDACTCSRLCCVRRSYRNDRTLRGRRSRSESPSLLPCVDCCATDRPLLRHRVAIPTLSRPSTGSLSHALIDARTRLHAAPTLSSTLPQACTLAARIGYTPSPTCRLHSHLRRLAMQTSSVAHAHASLPRQAALSHPLSLLLAKGSWAALVVGLCCSSLRRRREASRAGWMAGRLVPTVSLMVGVSGFAKQIREAAASAVFKSLGESSSSLLQHVIGMPWTFGWIGGHTGAGASTRKDCGVLYDVWQLSTIVESGDVRQGKR